MKIRGILIVGVIMAVVLLVGTGFSGTVYAKEYTPENDTKILKVSKPVWIKNEPNEKIFSFVAGNTKYIIHYRLIDLNRYTVWITSISDSGKKYTASYTVDYKMHKAWIDGKEIKIKKVNENVKTSTSKSTYTYRRDRYLRYINDGNPNGGPIKYAHPYRKQPYWNNEHYSIGTWENELLVGKSLYHMQIGTESIGWITELPGALVGAALGALLGAYFGGHIGAAIGAVIGALIGFITGNVITQKVCDETGAGWQWINKHDVQEIIHAMNAWWPWEHWVHIDYYKLGMLGPYSGWVYVP